MQGVRSALAAARNVERAARQAQAQVPHRSLSRNHGQEGPGEARKPLRASQRGASGDCIECVCCFSYWAICMGYSCLVQAPWAGWPLCKARGAGVGVSRAAVTCLRGTTACSVQLPLVAKGGDVQFASPPCPDNAPGCPSFALSALGEAQPVWQVPDRKASLAGRHLPTKPLPDTSGGS